MHPKRCRTALAWSGTGPLPASLVFLFRYRTDRMPDSPACRHLYTRTRTCTRIHTYDVQHEHGEEHGHSAWTFSMDIQHGHSAWTISKDMDMHYGHGHAPWTWTCTMDMDMHHGYRDGQAPWMPECRNADKSLVRHR
jgi:hypothetical protein